MPFRRALLAAAVIVLVSAPLLSGKQAFATEPSAESQVMSFINAARTDRLAVHSGLLAVARDHSRAMASRGSLDHNDADARISNAAPDPMEINGAPDDGTPPASWCENVTYTMGVPESQASRRIYDQWKGSGAHGRCMNDTRRNVGAVGIYYDGQTWWATFIATVDNTPPGAPPPAPAADRESPSAAPTQAPAATTKAESTESAGRESGSDRTTEQPEASPGGLIKSIDQAPVAATDTQPRSREITLPSEAPVTVQATVNHPGRTSSLEGAAPPMSGESEPIVLLGYGWRELAAVAALLLLATLVLQRSIGLGRRLPVRGGPTEVERRDDVALPEIEPVGAGAARA